MHLAGDLGTVAVHGKRVECRNCRDAGLADEGGFPKLTHSNPDWRDDSHPCDDDTCSHLLEFLLVPRWRLLTGSAGISQPSNPAGLTRWAGLRDWRKLDVWKLRTWIAPVAL